jgi:hypothetical protein
MEWVPVYVSDLESLRALMAIGLIASAVLLRLTWRDGAAPKPRKTWNPDSYCPLHRGDAADCLSKHDPDIPTRRGGRHR